MSYSQDSRVFTVQYNHETVSAGEIKAKLRTEEAGPAGPYEVTEWTMKTDH